MATTALALAIITFVVQLIVYVAQAEQTRRENELTQTLHAELRSSLADLNARARGTETTMETMSDKLLDRALEVTGSTKLDELPPGFTRDVARNLAELMENPESRAGAKDGDYQTELPQKTWGQDEDERVSQLLLSWPSAEAEINEIQESLDGLSDFELGALAEAAQDELKYRNNNSTLAPSVAAPPNPTAALTFQRDLFALYGRKAYEITLAHLTEKGRRVSRIFVAEGAPPSGLQDLTTEVRSRADFDEVV